MTIKNRIKNAYNALTKQGYNSVASGNVIRNYGKVASFDPINQLTGITYKAVDKTGRALSNYELIVKKANGDVVINHPIYNLFKNPNPRQTASDFQHLYSMLMEIYGETFWYKVRGLNTNKVKEIYLLNPAQMEVKTDDGEIIGYILHKVNGDQIPFLPEDIHHDKYPNPFNELRGMSVLEKAAIYVNTEIATSTFTLNYIRNNASPSGIVSLPDMDKETFRQFAMQWREGYEGPENAGKTAFIRGGEANFKAVGATLKDVDQEITRKMAKDDVLMMLEMPKALLGMGEENGMGRANLDAIYYMFNSEKIEPIMLRLDRIYSTLLNEITPAQSLLVDHESPIPEDKEYKLATYEKGINKWLTANEIREAEGLEPIEGGDVLAENKPVDNTKAKKVVLKKQVKISKAEIKKAEKAKFENLRQSIEDVSNLYAGDIKKEIAKFADKQEKKVFENIGIKTKSSDWLFNVKEDSEVLALALLPIIIELMTEQSKQVVAVVGGEALVINETLKAQVLGDIKKIVGLYNEDTLKALSKTIAEGQAKNETLLSIKKRVEIVYTDAKGYRAERIAKTESFRASNYSAENTYLEVGFSKVEWFINPNACEFCRTYAGRTKEIGSKFTNIGDVITSESGAKMRIEYTDIVTPPLHPNCACTLVPVE
jgi:HK97 family phage portal protein